MRFFGQRHRCITYSARASPPSDVPEKPTSYSQDRATDDILSVMKSLGLDKVLVYKYDTAKGTLTANDPPAFVGAPGSGPRHFAFHPNGKNAYVINEISLTVTAFQYDADKGVLKPHQTITTLPDSEPTVRS